MSGMLMSKRFVGLTVLLAMVIGCSQSEYGDLGRVTGKVKMDGSPYSNAIVTFTPQNGRPSTGITNESGDFELVYIRATKGAEPGQHRVTITTIPPAQPDSVNGPAFKDPVPLKYNRRSELTRTVEKGSNEFEFELSSS